MLLDANILTSVQVAILGIVVVIGLFVLWRRIARLEERVEAVATQQHNMQAVAHMQNGGNMPDGNPMDDEALMAAIFELPLGMNVDEEQHQRTDGGVTVTEEEPAAPAAVPEPLPVQAPESEVAESEAGASKSKLRKLPVEALKDMLMSRGLSCEGNKAALIDRLAN